MRHIYLYFRQKFMTGKIYNIYVIKTNRSRSIIEINGQTLSVRQIVRHVKDERPDLELRRQKRIKRKRESKPGKA